MARPPSPLHDQGISASVATQLRAILSSPEFGSSKRRRELLRYLVDETLAGRGQELRAYAIGTSVLGRPASFDPQSDAIVRVELHRLRASLDSYYRTHPEAPLVISIPRGQLSVRFRTLPELEAAPLSLGICLPHRHGSADPALADGLASRLLTALTPFEGLRVVGPLPATQGGAAARARAAESRVRFLLRGSVRGTRERIRVELQLTDATDGEEVWAGSQDFGASEDLLAVEDAVLERTVGKLAGPYSFISRRLEAARRGGSGGPLQHAFRAHEAFLARPNPAGFAEARAAVEEASRREPEAGGVLGLLADLYLTAWWLGLAADPDLLERGETLARRAVELDPTSQNARFSLSFAHFLRRRRGLFRMELERARELNPQNALVVAGLGLLAGCDGDVEQGLSMIAEAVRRNPDVPPWWRLLECVGHYQRGDYERALQQAEQFRMPDLYLGPLLRAACLGALGRGAEAAPEVERLGRELPGLREQGRERLARVLHDDDLVERLLAGLAGAGAEVDTALRIARPRGPQAAASDRVE